MEVITLVSLLALPSVLLKIFKSLRSPDKEQAIGALVIMGLTILVLALAGQAEATSDWVVSDQFGPLGDLDFASVVLLGMMYGSTVAKAYDLQNAIDNSSTAREPRLLAPPKK